MCESSQQHSLQHSLCRERRYFASSEGSTLQLWYCSHKSRDAQHSPRHCAIFRRKSNEWAKMWSRPARLDLVWMKYRSILSQPPKRVGVEHCRQLWGCTKPSLTEVVPLHVAKWLVGSWIEGLPLTSRHTGSRLCVPDKF